METVDKLEKETQHIIITSNKEDVQEAHAWIENEKNLYIKEYHTILKKTVLCNMFKRHYIEYEYVKDDEKFKAYLEKVYKIPKDNKWALPSYINGFYDIKKRSIY